MKEVIKNSAARQDKNSLRWVHRSCPVCGIDDIRIIFSDRNRREGYPLLADFVTCKACGMRYLSTIPEFDQWFEEYSNLYQTSSNSKHDYSHFKRIFIKLVNRWEKVWADDNRWHQAPFGPGDGKRILDVGCSSGDKLITYMDRGFEIYGIDITPNSIEDARRNVKGTFFLGSFETLDLPQNYFDYIRFDNVLEHIYQPEFFLKKVHSLLKRGGEAYGYVPNGTSPTMKLFGKYSINSWIPFHINLFPPKSLSQIARQVGFEPTIIQIANPHGVMQSFRQWRNSNNTSFDETNFDYFDLTIKVISSPIWWLLAKIWQGEELLLIAKKPEE